MALRYAEVSPYGLNPDQDTWEGIVQSIPTLDIEG